MKNNSLLSTNTSAFTLLALILTIFVGVFFLGACGKADAKGKKSNSKKNKTEEKTESEAPKTEDEANADTKTEKDKEETRTDGTTGKTKEETVAEKKTGTHDEIKKALSTGKKELKAGKGPVKDEKSGGRETKADADKIWKDLVAGNKRFMAGKHTGVNYSAARQSLIKGQHPNVIVLGCADSRVPPEFVFDKNLGDLFVIREAGNIADEVSLGSIEYAVEHLHSKVIVVLGHESCGAVAAAVSGKEMPTANLREIVGMIAPAFEGSKTCLIGKDSNLACVELNVKRSSGDLLKKSPVIKKAVDSGELTVIRAVYHMDTGAVQRVD